MPEKAALDSRQIPAGRGSSIGRILCSKQSCNNARRKAYRAEILFLNNDIAQLSKRLDKHQRQRSDDEP